MALGPLGLLVAGMYQPGVAASPAAESTHGEPTNAALIVYAGESLDDVTRTFDEDPYWRSGGIITRRVVRTWDPPLGPWVADATQSPA